MWEASHCRKIHKVQKENSASWDFKYAKLYLVSVRILIHIPKRKWQSRYLGSVVTNFCGCTVAAETMLLWSNTIICLESCLEGNIWFFICWTLHSEQQLLANCVSLPYSATQVAYDGFLQGSCRQQLPAASKNGSTGETRLNQSRGQPNNELKANLRIQPLIYANTTC